MVRVEHVLDTWKTVREDCAIAVEEYPAGDFDSQPIPDVASFRNIARHILDAGDSLTGLLLAGEEQIVPGPVLSEKRKAYVRTMPEGYRPVDLARALRESVEQQAAKLESQPTAFFEHVITRPDGLRVTRLEFVQWIKEHELCHRQQLFMYLRLKGIVPSTTRRRLAKTAAK